MRKLKTAFLVGVFLFLALALGGCGPDAPSAAADSPPPSPLPAWTPAASPTAKLPSPTATSVPTATPVRTPPALPPPFQTDLLNPLDVPRAYIDDTCQYLRARWTPGNAEPGTVVMVIMLHSIVRGETTNPNQMQYDAFRRLMDDLHAQGFVAITTEQLADFMEHNAYIPPRSVLLVADDRHYRQYFDTFFRPYWEAWGWPVVNSWISHPDTLPQVWEENVALETEGWVDHQAHGVVHNIPMSDDSSDAYIYGELQGSIDAFEQYYDKRPVAIIWPGGGFGRRPVEIARQLGYRLGFTINPRGPLLFNWVPQADEADPQRPVYLPEGPAGDPLLTLPRYWSSDASQHIDTVRLIGNAARAYAEAHRETELLYYDIVCAPQYGPLPGNGEP